MEPNKYYHVYNRSNNNEVIFGELTNINFFLNRVQKYLISVCDIYAYCIMPTHFHFIIKTKSFKGTSEENTKHAGRIDLAFRNLFISYAKAFNKLYNRHGSVFQKNYKTKEVVSDLYFFNLVIYIHQNPVIAGLVDLQKNYQFSSYSQLLSGEKTFLKRKQLFKKFYGKKQFIKYHKDKVFDMESLKH